LRPVTSSQGSEEKELAWRIRELTSKDEILAFLEQDRFYAAYAIGDLEPDLFAYCQWFGAEEEGFLRSLALLFTRLDPPVLFIMGEGAGLSVILGSALRPSQAYFTFLEEHIPFLEGPYRLAPPRSMLRMKISAEDFRPVKGSVVKLGVERLADLERLYENASQEGIIMAFNSYQLAQGVFYGVEADGQLVSAAGTHIVAPTYRMAAVGNVFTHPDYRGRGYATVCTSAVVEELLGRGLDVVLNVGEDNTPAISIYRRLGFRLHCRFLEALGYRKSTLTNLEEGGK